MADQYEIKDGTFTLFRVEDKESDRHPDYTGKGKTPSGELVYVAGWIKESKSGKKYLSCTIQEPRDKQPTKTGADKVVAELKEDLPF